MGYKNDSRSTAVRRDPLYPLRSGRMATGIELVLELRSAVCREGRLRKLVQLRDQLPDEFSDLVAEFGRLRAVSIPGPPPIPTEPSPPSPPVEPGPAVSAPLGPLRLSEVMLGMVADSFEEFWKNVESGARPTPELVDIEMIRAKVNSIAADRRFASLPAVEDLRAMTDDEMPFRETAATLESAIRDLVVAQREEHLPLGSGLYAEILLGILLEELLGATDGARSPEMRLKLYSCGYNFAPTAQMAGLGNTTWTWRSFDRTFVAPMPPYVRRVFGREGEEVDDDVRRCRMEAIRVFQRDRGPSAEELCMALVGQLLRPLQSTFGDTANMSSADIRLVVKENIVSFYASLRECTHLHFHTPTILPRAPELFGREDGHYVMDHCGMPMQFWPENCVGLSLGVAAARDQRTRDEVLFYIQRSFDDADGVRALADLEEKVQARASETLWQAYEAWEEQIMLTLLVLLRGRPLTQEEQLKIKEELEYYYPLIEKEESAVGLMRSFPHELYNVVNGCFMTSLLFCMFAYTFAHDGVLYDRCPPVDLSLPERGQPMPTAWIIRQKLAALATALRRNATSFGRDYYEQITRDLIYECRKRPGEEEAQTFRRIAEGHGDDPVDTYKDIIETLGWCMGQGDPCLLYLEEGATVPSVMKARFFEPVVPPAGQKWHPLRDANGRMVFVSLPYAITIAIQHGANVKPDLCIDLLDNSYAPAPAENRQGWSRYHLRAVLCCEQLQQTRHYYSFVLMNSPLKLMKKWIKCDDKSPYYTFADEANVIATSTVQGRMLFYEMIRDLDRGYFIMETRDWPPP